MGTGPVTPLAKRLLAKERQLLLREGYFITLEIPSRAALTYLLRILFIDNSLNVQETFPFARSCFLYVVK